MSVDVSNVDYIARLARLEFDEYEKEKFTCDFNNILMFVEKLSKIDMHNVEISINPYMQYNSLREDKVTKSFSRDELLKNTPESKDGYVKVPKVIE